MIMTPSYIFSTGLKINYTLWNYSTQFSYKSKYLDSSILLPTLITPKDLHDKTFNIKLSFDNFPNDFIGGDLDHDWYESQAGIGIINIANACASKDILHEIGNKRHCKIVDYLEDFKQYGLVDILNNRNYIQNRKYKNYDFDKYITFVPFIIEDFGATHNEAKKISDKLCENLG